MADDREPVVSERAHGGNQVPGPGSFGVRGMVGSRCRLPGAAVPGKIGADNCQSERCQLGSHPMPGSRGPRIPVQQQHRRTSAAVTDEQLQAVSIDHGLCKTFEHADSLPVVRSDAPHPELPKTTLDRQSH